MKVHKNFLSKEEFDKIKEILLGPNFSWFYNSKILSDSQPLNTFQFTHTFFKDYLIQSNYFNLLKPIMDKIKCLSLLKIKANLLTKTNTNIDYGFHTDYYDDRVTTGILYINTNDGYTKFKDGVVEKSEENKYVEFNSKLFHSGSSCTNDNIRVVINFNYIK